MAPVISGPPNGGQRGGWKSVENKGVLKKKKRKRKKKDENKYIKGKKGDLSPPQKKKKRYKGWELGGSQGKCLKAKIEGFISACPPVFSFFKWKK